MAIELLNSSSRLPIPPVTPKVDPKSPWIAGRYELLNIAGSGGMARVWRAVQHGSVGYRRLVAVKEMHEHLSDSDQYIAMFAEEARINAALSSPNVAHIYDFVEDSGRYYLVMEWIDGLDLGNYINTHLEQGKRSEWSYIAAIAIGVLRALGNAHERNDDLGNHAPIIHRDISPHNILIKESGMVKVIDWGLSLARDRGRDTTEPGVVKGKMSYLSPEVVSGNRPSLLSDQFSVGCVLWEALAGRRLFNAKTDLEVYRMVRECNIPPLKPIRRDVPKGLVQAIERALHRSPQKRFPSAREMGKQIAKVLKSSATPKDLHALLGRSITDARTYMSSQDSSNVKASSSSDRFEQTPTIPWNLKDIQFSMEKEPQVKRGLLHRLPFWGNRRT